MWGVTQGNMLGFNFFSAFNRKLAEVTGVVELKKKI